MATSDLTAHEKRYVALITDFCIATNIDDATAVLGGEEFTLHGTQCRLSYFASLQPDILCVYCHIGTLPPHQQAETCVGLLQLNAIRYESTAPVIGLQPGTDMLVASSRIRLPDLTVPLLNALLHRLASDALAWRQHIGQDSPAATDSALQGK